MARMVAVPTALVQRSESWLARASTRVTGWVSKFLAAGLQIGVGRGLRQASADFDENAAMQAYGLHPWVFVCVQAVSTDLAGLRIVAQRGEGEQAEQTTDHWFLQLLKRPSPKVSGTRFRKQLYADLRLTSNAYIRVWRNSAGRPIMLGRVPPQTIEPLVGNDGEEVGWKVNGTQELKWRDVLHVSDISVLGDERAVLGTSAIKPLSLGLRVESASRKSALNAAKRGRIEMLVSPKGETILGQEKVDAIEDQFVHAGESGNGIYVVGAGLEAHSLTYTARDGEFVEVVKMTKNEVLAAMQVPPVRAGDPAANYGTAKQQMRTYWESLRGLASLIDDEFTRLVDEPGVTIMHSFAGVEALQTSYTERQQRAAVWAQIFGMDRKAAARYEGFIDAPVPAGPIPTPAPATPGSPSPSKPKVDEPRVTNGLGADLFAALQIGRDMYDSEDTDAAERSLTFWLRSALGRAGVRAADEIAVEAAKLCTEASCARDDKGDMLSTKAFGHDHVSRILAMAGAQ